VEEGHPKIMMNAKMTKNEDETATTRPDVDGKIDKIDEGILMRFVGLDLDYEIFVICWFFVKWKVLLIFVFL
jgi:hypothetical protein